MHHHRYYSGFDIYYMDGMVMGLIDSKSPKQEGKTSQIGKFNKENYLAGTHFMFLVN